MIEYNGKTYDVPSELFLLVTDPDISEAISILTETEVLNKIASVYSTVSSKIRDKHIFTAYALDYDTARKEYRYPILPTHTSIVVMQLSKLEEIKLAKKEYQALSIKSDIDSTEYTFFGGLESARKYKEAFDLALSLGLDSGKILVEEGLVDITEPDMKIALDKIGLQVYKGWLKEQYYIQAIDTATTKEQIDAIMWED